MRDRRSFLQSLGIVAGASALAIKYPKQAFAETEPIISIRQAAALPPVNIPADFIGLGYEMSSVAPIGLLSAKNARYMQLIANLGSRGVFRVGGIVAEYTQYQPQGTIAAEPKNTVITKTSLEQFAVFLRKTGWNAIWSVNFGRGTLEEALAEARDVARILGPSLQALEIGNEVENYSKGDHPLRKPPYDYETYRAEYRIWHAALKTAVPQLRFAAPDTAASIEWVERMASDADGDVQLLTTHYYRNHQTKGTAEQLAFPDTELRSKLERLKHASETSGIPWRMCETNSFSGGGKPGVSDTLLGALWTLDYMLLLASYGCAGVNMETGVNQLGFISSYSPVQDDGHHKNFAGAPYYGMLACADALREAHEVLPLEWDTRGINLTAYLLGRAGTPRTLVVVNRDNHRDATISFEDLKMGTVAAHFLSGVSFLSAEGVTYRGSSIDSEGRWKAAPAKLIHSGSATVPRMSAVILQTQNA